VPVFRAWLTHWSRSGKAMETRVPESPGLGGKGSPGTGLEMSQALACGGNIALGSETFQPFRWANRTARVEWVPAPDRAAAAEDRLALRQNPRLGPSGCATRFPEGRFSSIIILRLSCRDEDSHTEGSGRRR